MPKVSVLMPVYRTNEQFLREAIESILNQTFTDFEFLILDDCPEDDRETIVKSYKDKRIKYSKNEKNMGISASRNRLIDMAEGEYLAVFDHDDVSLPTRFEKQVEFLDAHRDFGVVSVKFKKMIRKKVSNYPSDDDNIKLTLVGGVCTVIHPASMIRKSVLTENNIRYEERFTPAEDYALWCRLIKYTKFYNLNDEVLFLYRDHRENTSHKWSEKMSASSLAIMAFTRVENPLLYQRFLLECKHVTYHRLFGIIPILVSVRTHNRTKSYLFGKILIWYSKCKIKL